MLKNPSGNSKDALSVQLISIREEVQELINEFEINDQLRKKGQIGLDGLYCL